jgi:hypothetical protein
MMADTLDAQPARIHLDPTPDDRIILVAITDDLDSIALRLTTGQAARLGHRLLDMARRVERQGDADEVLRDATPDEAV